MNNNSKIGALLISIGSALLFSSGKAAAQNRDDSTWINTGITSAIANGLHEYNLPAGTYVLQNPIVIPPGTSNFALKGAGSSSTLLTAPNGPVSQFVFVGATVSGYWPFTRNQVALTANVRSGNTVLYVAPGTSITVGHYIDLFDGYVQHPNTDPTVSEATHSELLKVKSYNAYTGAITVDSPACREYTYPSIADVNSIVCTGITVQGLGFDGSVTGSINTSGTFVTDMLTDNLKVTDVVGSNFTVAAVLVDNARNATISNCAGNVASDASSGGYTFFIESSHWVSVTGCSATTAQHGFELHGGTTDVTFTNCTGTSAPFDMHGMDERRASFVNCQGDFSCGNAAWANGDSSITMSGCTFASTHLCAYTYGLQATGCNFQGQLWLDSSLHNVTNPAQAQAPTNLVFTNCSVTCPSYAVTNDQVGGTMLFKNCTLTSNQASWGYVMNWSVMAGASIDLEGCTLNMGSNAYPAVSLSGSNISFTCRNSTINSGGGATYGITVGKAFTGALNISGDTFNSSGKGATLLQNLSNVTQSS